MLIKPFLPLLREQIDPTTLSYIGSVEDNKDPKKLGRVKVRVSPYADLKTKDLPWASPKLGSYGNISSAGGLNVPEVGSQVRVFFPSRDFTAPYYEGAELNEKNRTTFFDEDYPETYGYKDTTGNFIKVNKAKGTVHIQHSSTTNMQVSPQGSIRIGLSNGAFFIFDNSNKTNNFELNIGTVDVTGTADGTLSVAANNEIILEAPTIRLRGKVIIEGDLSANNGISTTFMAQNNLVTTKDGLVVSIS